MTIDFDIPQWTTHRPRRWQSEAFDAAAGHLAFIGKPAVISAIMGSGKSVLIAELAATAKLARGEVVVVSTSSQHLVETLSRDIAARCGRARSVGVWYAERKRLGDVIVSCMPSLRALAGALGKRNRVVALWIADEVHRVESPTVMRAHEVLRPWNSLGLTATAFRSCHKQTISLFDICIYRYGVQSALGDRVVVPWRIVNWAAGDAELDPACIDMIREAEGPGLVNAADIADACAFAGALTDAGLRAGAIHSRLNSRERARVLADLQSGKLRAVVHVNMLSEGANFPWLRWMLLRREVGARVRFIQEIGRLLRSHPGKSDAVFYDPHDLFGSFRLSYEEALGEAPEQPEEETPEEPAEVAERLRSASPPVALALIESVIRSLVVSAEAAGILRGRKIIAKAERVRPSTALQGVAIGVAIDAADRLAPIGWRTCLAAVAARPESLRYGFAADLLTALYSVARAGRWPDVGADGRISAAQNAAEVV